MSRPKRLGKKTIYGKTLSIVALKSVGIFSLFWCEFQTLLTRSLKYQTAGKILTFKTNSMTAMGMFRVPGNEVVLAFMAKNHLNFIFMG